MDIAWEEDTLVDGAISLLTKLLSEMACDCGSHVKVIAVYLSLKTKYNEEIHFKVEMFLKANGTSKPKRYTFSEVKKIARRFKQKVGQGGFGSVYRGELPNGVPVAVKMLENSTGE
ncbi:hypothetical protein EJB05_15996, partial [Eragrostis curvula]